MSDNFSIEQNLKQILLIIRDLEQKYNRPNNSVQLLAVSKTKPVNDIITANACGQTSFGENYVQEAVEKINALKNNTGEKNKIEWHFIGPLQKNKTRSIAENFDWVHSVDRHIIAQRLSKQRPSDLPPLQICIQVNIDSEKSKSGVTVENIQRLTDDLVGLESLKLRGLMAIPKISSDTTQQRKSFAAVREQLEKLNQQGYELDTLSMGMSADLEAAIAEGATIVRIGTAIFGKRD